MHASGTTDYTSVPLPPLTKCSIGNLQIAYRRAGTGKPVLLVHGITTNSFIWRRVIPFLKSNYDIIAVDLLGCGGSDKHLEIDYSLNYQANLLTKLVAELDLPKLHLVGHDIGGGIAQVVAVNAPNALLDMVLINTIGYDYWPVQPIIAMRTPIIRQLALATLDWGMLKLIVKRAITKILFLKVYWNILLKDLTPPKNVRLSYIWPNV